jgi:hypothetical protein
MANGRAVERGEPHAAAAGAEVFRRLCKSLRVPASRFTPAMRARLGPYLEDGSEPSGFEFLRERARGLLYAARTSRRKAKRDRLDVVRAVDAWADPDERLRTLTFNAELGRLAAEFGGLRDDQGRWEMRPEVLRFRENVLGGKRLSPAKADAFLRAHARTSHGMELRGLGERLARHYLWDERQAQHFVLTGIVPSPPVFTMKLDGGMSHDHAQYRVNLTVPLWARASTLARMLKTARTRFQGPTNRPLSEARLQLVDFVAPLRHKGMSWAEVTKRWNRAHPMKRKHVRNLERDFSDTYSLLMRPKVNLAASARR